MRRREVVVGGVERFKENELAKLRIYCRSHASRSREFLFFVVSGQKSSLILGKGDFWLNLMEELLKSCKVTRPTRPYQLWWEITSS